MFGCRDPLTVGLIVVVKIPAFTVDAHGLKLLKLRNSKTTNHLSGGNSHLVRFLSAISKPTDEAAAGRHPAWTRSCKQFNDAAVTHHQAAAHNESFLSSDAFLH